MDPEQHKPQIEEKSINDAQGFECQVCHSVRIKLSLAQFLNETACRCPVCGTKYEMDKSQCAGLVSKLQELHVVTENVKLLKSKGS